MKTHSLAALLLLTLLASSARASDLDMSGLETPEDKLPAARRLLNWLQSAGYSVKTSSDGKDVLVMDYKLVITPITSTSLADRLMVFNTYAGRPENVGDQKLEAEIDQVNREQSRVHVGVNGSGDIVFTSLLYFDDRLSPRLFKLYMEECNFTAESILKRHPKLAARVK